MARRSAFLFVVLVLSVVLSNCAKREDRVVANVEGKLVTVADVEGRFRARPDWSPEQVDSAKAAALDQLIESKLMALEGERLGYGSNEEITKGVDDVKKRAMVNELYQKVVVERARVSEREVRKQYDRLGHEVKARHIVLGSEEMADSIYSELTKKGGKGFEELAKECSADKRTQAKGGDLGWIRWGRMPEEFQEAAFSMKIGETSKPVKTRMGYHIIKVDDRREAERGPWEQESVRIRQQLERAEMKRLADAYMEGVKEKADVRIDEDVLKMLAEKTPKQARTMFAPPPLPSVTEEDRLLVLMSSKLGEWTVGKVLEEVEKFPRRPSFDQQERIRGFVEWLVTNEILLNEAERYHLDRSRKVMLQVESEIDRRLADKVSREQIDAKAEASEGELTEYYEAHIEDYTQPERVQASQIVVETEKEAEGILKRLRLGADFAALAREKSIHPSKARGGELGLFTRGTHPDIEEVAFSLRIGRISEPIQTEGGFALVKVTRKEPEVVQSFDEVKARVENGVLRENKEKLRREILTRLRAEVEVAISRRNLLLVGAGG